MATSTKRRTKPARPKLITELGLTLLTAVVRITYNFPKVGSESVKASMVNDTDYIVRPGKKCGKLNLSSHWYTNADNKFGQYGLMLIHQDPDTTRGMQQWKNLAAMSDSYSQEEVLKKFDGWAYFFSTGISISNKEKNGPERHLLISPDGKYFYAQEASSTPQDVMDMLMALHDEDGDIEDIDEPVEDEAATSEELPF
tara:strand:- start:1091 stop:1684 length:594 start_codon:yes stop_codon:yes gene_type:complete